jgi:twinkle protein
LEEPEQIILAVDGDEVGEVLREELSIRLRPERCWVVKYPEKCKDPNDVLIHYGAERLRELIRSAQPLVQNNLAPLSIIPTASLRDQYTTGWSALDGHLKICPPELFIVTGKPGDGKTNWTLNLCLNLARIHGASGAYIQFEDNIERMRKDILSYADYWFSNPDKDGVLIDKAEWADWACKVIKPAEEEEDIRNLAWVHHAIWEAAVRHGCKWVVLDPWNEIEHMWAGKGQSEAEYLNSAIRDLKRLARRYRIALGIVAHPDKNAGLNHGFEEMSLYSIAGGAAWNNKADHGIVVAREKDQKGAFTGATFVKTTKCKDHSMMGVPGQARFQFDHKTRTFTARPW